MVKSIKKVFAASSLLAAGLFSSNVSAGLVGVSYIEIANSIGHHTQIAEVIALDEFGNDWALMSAGATAFAPNQWSSLTAPSNAIDGNTSGRYGFGEIYHDAAGQSGTTLTISFDSLKELFSFGVYGRTDCCRDRDVFSVSFFDEDGTMLFASVLDARTPNQFAQVELPNTEVSEPGMMALFGLGLAGLVSIRRRTKHKS